MQDETGRDDATISLRVSTVSAMVSAFVGNNHVTLDQIPAVVAAFTAEADKLMGGNVAVEVAPAEPEKVQPFTSIRKSVTPDHLISLFDGRKFKSLKRYLATTWKMSPDEYRAYFNLPKDYPMVAPNYAAKRSELAKSIGLGRGGRGGAAGSTAKATTIAEAAPAPTAKAPKAPKAAAPAKTKAAPKTARKAAPSKADLNKAGIGTGEAAKETAEA